MQTVEKFAKLLDRNNFIEAQKLIASDCTYQFRGQTIVGPEAIIDCYRGSFESVDGQLDEIILESDLEPLPDQRWQINYTDHIRKGSNEHTHRCQQVITEKGGWVIAIEHVDLPGEAEALEEYFRQVGVVRKSR